MEKDFEDLIASLIENNIAESNNLLSANLSKHLKLNLLKLYDTKSLMPAGIGNLETPNYNKLIRSDTIYWLDKKHNDLYENAYFKIIEDFIRYLNMTCYTGISDYEFHYSLYEVGSFYKKHIDQFQNNGKRQYSVISYLNEDWKLEDGGELMINNNNVDQLISPLNMKTVLFKSNELEHEVLITNKRRMSVTGWLKSS